MKDIFLCTGLRWIWLTILILLIDLSSKYYITSHFQLQESLPLLPCFSLTYVRNIGAAFSIFAGHRWPLVLIAIIICLLLLIGLYRNAASNKWLNMAYALIIGGALGNLYDRLIHGYVIDFFHFYLINWRIPLTNIIIENWHYAVFNVADIAICCGAILIVLDTLMTIKKERRQ